MLARGRSMGLLGHIWCTVKSPGGRYKRGNVRGTVEGIHGISHWRYRTALYLGTLFVRGGSMYSTLPIIEEWHLSWASNGRAFWAPQ